MSEMKLKPCPFCGRENEVYEIEPHTHTIADFMPDHKGSFFIDCNCGIVLVMSAKEEIITTWNTRSLETELLEALEEALISVEYEANQKYAGRENALNKFIAEIELLIAKAKGETDDEN
jgi:hypothetical protein